MPVARWSDILRLKLKNVRGDYGANNDLILSYNKHQAAFAESAQATFLKIEDTISKRVRKARYLSGMATIRYRITSTALARRLNVIYLKSEQGAASASFTLGWQRRKDRRPYWNLVQLSARVGCIGWLVSTL